MWTPFEMAQPLPLRDPVMVNLPRSGERRPQDSTGSDA
jgi:hypothetical protein